MWGLEDVMEWEQCEGEKSDGSAFGAAEGWKVQMSVGELWEGVFEAIQPDCAHADAHRGGAVRLQT